jgi:phospholipid transport system substrate-binding protein
MRESTVNHWWRNAVAVCLLMPALLFAGEPTETLRGTIDQVLSILRDDGLEVEAKREQIRDVINKRFDYQAMSQSTLAQNWRTASTEQKRRFVELYARLMQDTYLVLVEEYNNQDVSYGEEKIRKARYAQVDTVILDQGKQIPVVYKLRLKDGEWFVYDVVIEGVSMINNYRSSYQQIVRNDGMDGLLTKIQAKLDEVGSKPATTSN